MVINISRLKTYSLCRRKAFNSYHRDLTDPKRSMNLVDGSAFHAGVASGLATKDWSKALEAARANFEDEKKDIPLIPGTEWQQEDHWDMIVKMVECYRDAFEGQGIQVIQPECEFDVELPDSKHHCIWLHHLTPGPDKSSPWFHAVEHWGPPSPEDILAGRVMSPHQLEDGDDLDTKCLCYGPHRFVGKTDAVVVWNGMIWLLEHKTTAILGEQFWAQWRLDIQPTGYIYGIQRSLGLKVGGFVLNAIWKPSEAQVSAWNKKRKNGADQAIKDYIKYEREPFLRSAEDLQRFERELIHSANEWERSIISGTFPHDGFANKGCQQYNRVCEYHSMCACHDAPNEMEALAQRERDYVDLKTLKLAGLELAGEEKMI